MPDDHLGHSIINSLTCNFYKTLETPKSKRMSTPANNLGISSKSEENSSDESGKKCGFNSNVECQSLKRPRTMNSRTAQEDNRSNVPTCLQFIRLGRCAYGDNCRYAHTTGSQYGPVVEQRNLGKLESCRFFASGKTCPYGNECQFLHERSKGLYRESSAIIIATTGHEVKNKTHSGTPEPKRSVDLRKEYLKTRLCTKWERTGSCSYGSTCQFAHGKAELQSLGSYNPPESWSSAGISVPAKNTASDKIGFSALSERPRFVFKWTDIKKISQIYADWIETV